MDKGGLVGCYLVGKTATMHQWRARAATKIQATFRGFLGRKSISKPRTLIWLLASTRLKKERLKIEKDTLYRRLYKLEQEEWSLDAQEAEQELAIANNRLDNLRKKRKKEEKMILGSQ